MDDRKYHVLHFLLENGETKTFVARTLGVDRATIRLWAKRSSPPSQKHRRTRVTNQMLLRRAAVDQLASKTVSVTRTRLTPKRKKPVSRPIRRKPYDTVSKVCRALNSEKMMKCCPSTVRKDLIVLGYKSKRRPTGPYLTSADMKQRVTLCTNYLRNPYDIAFSDETNIDSNEFNDTRTEWVKEGQFPLQRCMEQGPASLTCWGVIAKDFRYLIVVPSDQGRMTAEKYQQIMLKPCLKQLQELSKRNIWFMQDNAPTHSGAADYLARRRIKVLSNWPPRSCDLNPIEGVWSLLKRRVAARGPFGEDMLRDFILDEWSKIPVKTMNQFVESFQDKCRRCKSRKGATI